MLVGELVGTLLGMQVVTTSVGLTDGKLLIGTFVDTEKGNSDGTEVGTLEE